MSLRYFVFVFGFLWWGTWTCFLKKKIYVWSLDRFCGDRMNVDKKCQPTNDQQDGYRVICLWNVEVRNKQKRCEKFHENFNKTLSFIILLTLLWGKVSLLIRIKEEIHLDGCWAAKEALQACMGSVHCVGVDNGGELDEDQNLKLLQGCLALCLLLQIHLSIMSTGCTSPMCSGSDFDQKEARTALERSMMINNKVQLETFPRNLQKKWEGPIW